MGIGAAPQRRPAPGEDDMPELNQAAAPPRRRHLEVMRELLEFAGKRVIDVGCGDGALARALTREGAHVTGVEIDAAMLAPAQAAAPVGNERYVEGRGENLPFAEEAADIVIYFNSLHHVPAGLQAKALLEACRVLVPEGALCIVEPLAEGSYFELLKPVEDETAVRAHTYRVIQDTIGAELAGEREFIYVVPLKFASFAEWTQHFLAVDPARREVLDRRRGELEANFHRLAEARDGAFRFAQPARLNLLRKRLLQP
jgi:SAM-dependent methyltransferase